MMQDLLDHASPLTLILIALAFLFFLTRRRILSRDPASSPGAEREKG